MAGGHLSTGVGSADSMFFLGRRCAVAHQRVFSVARCFFRAKSSGGDTPAPISARFRVLRTLYREGRAVRLPASASLCPLLTWMASVLCWPTAQSPLRARKANASSNAVGGTTTAMRGEPFGERFESSFARRGEAIPSEGVTRIRVTSCPACFGLCWGC